MPTCHCSVCKPQDPNVPRTLFVTDEAAGMDQEVFDKLWPNVHLFAAQTKILGFTNFPNRKTDDADTPIIVETSE